MLSLQGFQRVKQLTHRDRAGKPIQVDAHAFSFVENTNLQSHHLGAELRRQRGTVVAQELWCGMCLREGSSGRAKLLTMTLGPSEAPTIGTMPLKLGGSCICPWGSPVSHSSPAMRVWLTEIIPWETANGPLTSPPSPRIHFKGDMWRNQHHSGTQSKCLSRIQKFPT